MNGKICSEISNACSAKAVRARCRWPRFTDVAEGGGAHSDGVQKSRHKSVLPDLGGRGTTMRDFDLERFIPLLDRTASKSWHQTKATLLVNTPLSVPHRLSTAMSRHPHGPSDIPSINITDSPEPSQPATSSSGAAKVGSLLSPTSPGVAPSLHASELSEAGSVPPSPTLSSHSATFPTTLQLRGNQPDAQSGYASLQLLGPGTQSFRKGSDASMTDVGTSELDLQSSISGTTTATHVNLKGTEETDGKKKKKGKKVTTEEESRTTHQIELAQDEAINPAPFAFKPYQLAHILDPKSFDTLASFGGTNGLLKGLGTTVTHGLSSDKGLHGTESKQPAKDRPSEGSETVPAIVLTTSEGQEVAPPAAPVEDGAAFAATLEDRRRVYGENVLPTRTSKTLLQLMWMAMQDKVLVSFLRSLNFLATERYASLDSSFHCSCSLFSAWSLPRFRYYSGAWPTTSGMGGRSCYCYCYPYCGKHHIIQNRDIHLTSIKVIVGSLNDWQKERQFRALNEKKDERSVKVIRDGSERMVDIKVTSSLDRQVIRSHSYYRTWSWAISPSWSLVKSCHATVFLSPATMLSATNLVLLANQMRSRNFPSTK